jgi:hypothetical protein
LSGESRDEVLELTGRRYLNINICTVFGHKNTLSDFLKHECYATL